MAAWLHGFCFCLFGKRETLRGPEGGRVERLCWFNSSDRTKLSGRQRQAGIAQRRRDVDVAAKIGRWAREASSP